MNKLAIAKLLRPIAVLYIPAFVVLYFTENNFLIKIMPLFIGALIGFLTKCKNCPYSLYYDKNYPIRTLLACPHKKCTNCQTIYDS
jgi:hypothetical protein